jgi:hypothetical protein
LRQPIRQVFAHHLWRQQVDVGLASLLLARGEEVFHVPCIHVLRVTREAPLHQEILRKAGDESLRVGWVASARVAHVLCLPKGPFQAERVELWSECFKGMHTRNFGQPR